MPWREYWGKIVGVTLPNDDGSSRQILLAKCSKGQKLTLVLRPFEQDRGAVAVLTRSGDQLGWLSRESAVQWAPVLRRQNDRLTCTITELTGGGWWLFKKQRGCNILISTSSESR